MILRQHSFGGKRRRGRNIELLRRRLERGSGARPHHAAAGEQQGPLGLGDHAGDALHIAGVGARTAEMRRARGRRLDLAFDLRELNVVGHFDEDRTRPARCRGLERVIEDLDRGVGPHQHPRSLADRAEDARGVLEALVINLLHAGLTEKMRGRAAGDDHDRRRLVHGAGAGADSVEQARPFRHDDWRNPAADAVVEIGHVHGMGFVLGLDALDLGLVRQGIEEGPYGPAGIAEIVLESGDLEPLGDRIDHTHLRAPWRGRCLLLDGPGPVRECLQQNSLQSTDGEATSGFR